MAKVKEEATRSFMGIKEGSTVFYTYKGERHQTTVTQIKTDKGLAFKTSNGNGVRMTSTEAEGWQYKSSDNVLWSLK